MTPADEMMAIYTQLPLTPKMLREFALCAEVRDFPNIICLHHSAYETGHSVWEAMQEIWGKHNPFGEPLPETEQRMFWLFIAEEMVSAAWDIPDYRRNDDYPPLSDPIGLPHGR